MPVTQEIFERKTQVLGTTTRKGTMAPFEYLTNYYLSQSVELLKAQKERLKLKVERQAVQITRLEESRKTLRRVNREMVDELKMYRDHPNAW